MAKFHVFLICFIIKNLGCYNQYSDMKHNMSLIDFVQRKLPNQTQYAKNYQTNSSHMFKEKPKLK